MKFLTKQEQLLLDSLPDLQIVDIDTIKNVNRLRHITSHSNLIKTIHNLIGKSIFLSVKRGLYYVVKPGSSADMFIVAKYAFEGYIGFDTALFLYGANPNYPTKMKIATSDRGYKNRLIGDVEFEGIPLGRLCYGEVELNGKTVSSRAKTVFDCVYKIDEVEDIGALFRMVKILEDDDFDEFLVHAKRLGNTSFYEKAGYIFQVAGAPERVVKMIRKNVKKAVVANLGKKAAKFERRFITAWRIYDNLDIGRFVE